MTSGRPLREVLRANIWFVGLAAAMILCTIIIAGFVVLPMVSAIAETRGDSASGEYDLDVWRRKAARTEQLRTENRILTARAEGMGATVARGEEPSHLLDVLIAAAGKSGIDFVSIVPSQIVDHGKYREVPLEIQLRARFHSVGRFVNEVERSSTTMKIVGISMSVPEEDVVQGSLEIGLEAVAYLVN
jgi:Tfp pilus assembly protein PilO